MNQLSAPFEEPKRFTVVMRGPAALVFEEGLQPEGLVLFDERVGGNAPLVTDVTRIDKLNQQVIATASNLRQLFAELQELPAFKAPS